jgi:hypothetical protein
MPPTSRLYDAMNRFVRQCQMQWSDVRHLQTLCWMMVGIIESQNVHLNGFGVYIQSRAQMAQSHQRRFRRFLENRRVDITTVHQMLITQALSQWGQKRLYLSLDTTLVWNCFCIVWVGVVYRGRTVVVAWRIVPQASSTVRLWTVQRVLRQASRALPQSAEIVLLADRGFADGKLLKYLKDTLHWHFRIRIKRSFQFQLDGQWRKVSSVKLQPGQAYFTPAVAIGKTRPYVGVYLAFTHDHHSREDWVIVTDEPTTLQTFAQISPALSSRGVLFRPQIEWLQSRSLAPTGQVCLVSTVWGDCPDDALFGLAGNSGGGSGETSPRRYPLESGHELPQAGVELGAAGADSALAN